MADAGEVPPIGAERHEPGAVRVPCQGAHLFPRRGIPDPERVVAAGAGHGPAVAAEGDAVNRGLRPGHDPGGDAVGAGPCQIPKFQLAVRACAGELAAVGAESHPVDRPFVAEQTLDRHPTPQALLRPQLDARPLPRHVVGRGEMVAVVADGQGARPGRHGPDAASQPAIGLHVIEIQGCLEGSGHLLLGVRQTPDPQHAIGTRANQRLPIRAERQALDPEGVHAQLDRLPPGLHLQEVERPGHRHASQELVVWAEGPLRRDLAGAGPDDMARVDGA